MELKKSCVVESLPSGNHSPLLGDVVVQEATRRWRDALPATQRLKEGAYANRYKKKGEGGESKTA